MHMKNNGYVPCFVSRPYEKTVFLRYMNILSFICMLITMFEVVQSIVRQFRNKPKPQRKRPGFDLEQQQLQMEPPSFETVMKRNAYGNERGGGIYNKGPPNNEPPASASLFECVSVEELEKQRDLKAFGGRRLKGNKEQDRKQVFADAPPYESDDSLASRNEDYMNSNMRNNF